VVLLGQRPQALGQQARRARLDRQLAGLGLEQRAFDGDQVAEVPVLESGVQPLGQRIALHEQLDGAAGVLQPREARLAHDPLRHHAPGDGHRDRLALQRLLVERPEGQVQVARLRIAAEIVRIGLARRALRLQLAAALRDQGVLWLFGHLVSRSRTTGPA
jgi:hypothetical protein